MSDGPYQTPSAIMKALQRNYDKAQNATMGFWCEDCGSMCKTLLPTPDGAVCPVCVYEAEQEERAREEAFLAERRSAYRQSERAFKDFLLAVKSELDEDEFLEQCRAYYRADW